jgi:phosphoribosylglycinamide formyltransferase-1
MIGLLTYQHPHRKTQDVLFRLLAGGFDVTIIAAPWQDRINFKPLFPHRPSSCMNIWPDELARRFGCGYIEISDYRELDNIVGVTRYIIGGAGIINPLPSLPIINSHPGFLPLARGLDALKWSIYYDVKPGITVHQVTKETDSGPILYRQEINTEPGEQFYHYAMRIYQAEVSALVEHFLKEPEDTDCDLMYENSTGRITKRMPHNIELEMIKKFVL